MRVSPLRRVVSWSVPPRSFEETTCNLHSIRSSSSSSHIFCPVQDEGKAWEQARERQQLVAATFKTMFPDSYQFTLPVHEHQVKLPFRSGWCYRVPFVT